MLSRTDARPFVFTDGAAGAFLGERAPKRFHRGDHRFVLIYASLPNPRDMAAPGETAEYAAPPAHATLVC